MSVTVTVRIPWCKWNSFGVYLITAGLCISENRPTKHGTPQTRCLQASDRPQLFKGRTTLSGG